MLCFIQYVLFSGNLAECSSLRQFYFLVRLFIVNILEIKDFFLSFYLITLSDFSHLSWFLSWVCQISVPLSALYCYTGFASAQKVIQLTYCSLDEHNLRMDCKYAVPPESPVPFCKYTNGERLFDTTDPDEEQHAPFKKRARVRIFPGNICRLLFKNLPNGKSNFTCNIKLADSGTASKTSVVEKSKLLGSWSSWFCFFHLSECQNKMLLLLNLHDFFLIAELLLPCSGWSVLLQSCSGLMLTLMTLPMLLEFHWL